MKPARIIISVILGISIFYCSSALSQRSPGSEVAMALDIQTNRISNNSVIKASALQSGGAESFELADFSSPIELSEQGYSQGLGIEEADIMKLITNEESSSVGFDDYKLLEDADYQKPALQINSEKISSSDSYSKAEKLLIARVVYAESRGEIFEGQVAVATVVLNRYESGLFGKSFAKIVFAPDQFAISSRHNSESLKAVEEAIENLGTYPKNMYFFQVSKSKTWRNFVYYKRIGNHSFYLSAK